MAHGLGEAVPLAGCVNGDTSKQADFVPHEESGGLRLTRQALAKFFRAYEAHLNRDLTNPVSGQTTTLRKSFRRQAERLAAHLTRGDACAPLLVTW